MVVRVLLLPGYSQNAGIFQQKFDAIQKQCGTAVEFAILEPLHPLKGGDFGPLCVDLPASYDSPELLPRAWWRADVDPSVYHGHLESVIYLRDFLASQKVPFDGILGFSQGAAMACLAVALLERPTLYPKFLINGNAPHPPLKFAVYVSGFRPQDVCFTALFEPGKLKTPSLHVLAKNDAMVGAKRSLTLIDATKDPRVQWHSGGHFIPFRASWPQFFKAYMTSFDQECNV